MRSESRRLQSVAVLALTFILGGVAGAGLFASFAPRHGPNGAHRPPGARRLPPPLEDLDLTEAQREAASAISERYRPRFDLLFQQTLPQVQALREEMDASLVVLLTDRQRARFEELKRRRPPFPGGGFPGGPPPERLPPGAEQRGARPPSER